MGSIHVFDGPQAGPDLQQLSGKPVIPPSGHGVVEVAADPELVSAPMAAVAEEVLLLAWLATLMRTREDTHVSFEWAYSSRDGETMKLVTDVMDGLDSGVEQAAANIARQTAAPQRRPESSATQLLLSTGSLSRSEGARDEVGTTGSQRKTPLTVQPLLHLEVSFQDGRLEVRPVWHSKDMLPFTVKRHAETFVDTVQLCLAHPAAPVSALLRPTMHDLDYIWGWNHELPPTHDACMHDLISERARQQPDKEAICSWDGSLSYAEVDTYSTTVAHLLRTDVGVQLADVVPICFEKSRWTIVAVLGVMKAGATMVLMDPTLPLARLQNMAEQVGGQAMLTSVSQHALGRAILPHGQLLTIDASLFSPATSRLPPLPPVPPSTLMYIIFTSGSTGTPKGVQISHRTYTSSALPRSAAVGYSPTSRVLDFASYAFDVSIDSMLLTLAGGGTLCIPSDAQRLDDISGAMRAMRVNYAGVTPSVARVLEPDVVAALTHGLGLGGEAVAAADVNVWGRSARIVIGYGPCECTIGCTINPSAATGREYISIGPGNGAAIWVVDARDHQRLVPVGAVGELLVEGPIVGQGYLNDPEKTAAAFVEDPEWLVAGHGGYPGRRGRLYKTGDLGRYDPDGSGGIVFAGRKDTQVKLRGQRVELGEIESQLRARLPQDAGVVAEVVVPQGASAGQSTLVAFVAPQLPSAGGQDVEPELVQLREELAEALAKADAELGEVLPRYMVPTAYIPVSRIPTLISGKTDRKRLRQFGAQVDLRKLTADSGMNGEAPGNRPLSDMEQRLRQAWGTVLTVDADKIRAEDNFFVLGGDSLAAMRLVALCRDQGMDLSVVSTFAHPTLSAMAAVVTEITESETEPERAPFSLLPPPAESAILEASQACGADPAAIEDMYPCTPTQESLFTFSLKSADPYTAQRVACIPAHIALDDWQRAWETVVAATPILRSRLVQLRDYAGLGQVVLRETIPWQHSTADLDAYLEADRHDQMGLGQRLARYAIVEPVSAPGKRYMVWTLHHAVYDGWSEPLVLQQVRDALAQSTPLPPPKATMADFVHHLLTTPSSTTHSFWRTALAGATGPQFPRLPSRDFVPFPTHLLTRHIPLDLTAHPIPFTLATLIRGAWALVSSLHAGGATDIVFGETLTGRDISLRGIDAVVGPVIATVPVRVRIDRAHPVRAYLSAIQAAALARAPHQHCGMQHIRRVSRDAQYACEAPAGLVVQPVMEEGDIKGGAARELGFGLADVVREAVHFNPYPLMVACGIERAGGFRVCASFDGRVVSEQVMGRVLAQLETVCGELLRGLDRQVGEVACVSAEEAERIWGWNREAPMVVDPSGVLRAGADGVRPGSVYGARAAVPWVCDLRNPALLAPIGIPGELWLEGNFLSGDGVVESPAWLLAGSGPFQGRAGKVQPTGDVVKLQEDGSLVFVGRKDEILAAQGHSADPAELEAHLAAYLPPPIRTAAAQASGQLVVFVEFPASEEELVEVLPEVHTVSFSESLNICASIPTSLAAALKRLDKFAQNSLASHLVPLAYVVVDKMPGKEIDRSLLQQLASRVPARVFDQLREGFRRVWSATPAQATALTTAEDILRSAWAAVLGLGADQIDADDNFFRLGGDSVLAMKLVSRLRAGGHGLTVADIFRHMRLGDAARVLKVDQFARTQGATPSQPLYRPFSMLEVSDTDKFMAEVRRLLEDPNWPVQDVYPVTDSQALDVAATVNPPRTSVQYTTLRSERGFDRERLVQACQKLVDAHDILRTVFVEHGSSFLQVVLKDLRVSLGVHVADDDLQQSVNDLCAAHIDSDAFRLGAPFAHFFLVQSQANPQDECLVLALSHAQYDGVSLPLLLRDLSALYAGTTPSPPTVPFSAYLALTRSPHTRAQALTYWRALLAGAQPSILPGQAPSPTRPQSKALFLSTPALQSPSPPPLQSAGLTTATLLTASWALVLARRLRLRDVTFGSITSGRAAPAPALPEAPVMGPCYQFTPVRVRFAADSTPAQVLRAVQRQAAESSAWDFVGPAAVAGEVGLAAGEGVWFDSVVHHQDWEEVEEMGFGAGRCRVGIVNPHGDAPRPLKVVSFVRGGQIHVGVVGCEEERGLVEEVLGELVGAVRELAAVGEERLVVDDGSA